MFAFTVSITHDQRPAGSKQDPFVLQPFPWVCSVGTARSCQVLAPGLPRPTSRCWQVRVRVRGLWQPVCWQNHSGDIPSRGVGLRAPSLAGHQARAGFAPGGPSRRVQSSPVPLPRRPWLRPCQLSASSARESSGFKGLCYRVGPARVIQGTLPVLMPASFVSDAKLPPLIMQRFHGFPGLRHGRLRGAVLPITPAR